MQGLPVGSTPISSYLNLNYAFTFDVHLRYHLLCEFSWFSCDSELFFFNPPSHDQHHKHVFYAQSNYSQLLLQHHPPVPQHPNHCPLLKSIPHFKISHCPLQCVCGGEGCLVPGLHALSPRPGLESSFHQLCGLG